MWTENHPHMINVGMDNGDYSSMRAGCTCVSLSNSELIARYSIGIPVNIIKTFLADRLWWDHELRGYSLVGGFADSGLSCGGSNLRLYLTVSVWYWDIVAFLLYIPELLLFVAAQLPKN